MLNELEALKGLAKKLLLAMDDHDSNAEEIYAEYEQLVGPLPWETESV